MLSIIIQMYTPIGQLCNILSHVHPQSYKYIVTSSLVGNSEFLGKLIIENSANSRQ